MNHIVKEFLKERNVEYLYEDFMNLLVSHDRLRMRIAIAYERDCHREDVRMELDEMGIKYTDEIAERITDIYEDRLLDLEEWHDVLIQTIKEFLTEEDDEI
jgi:anaerobic selenocysteine-containing dehydrogenase